MKTRTWKVRIKNIKDLESAKKLMNEDKIFRTVFKNCKNLEKLYINNLEFNIKDIYSISFWSCFTGVNSEIEIYCKPKMKEIIQEIWDKTHVKI